MSSSGSSDQQQQPSMLERIKKAFQEAKMKRAAKLEVRTISNNIFIIAVRKD
jgi:hypothetical protein